jgi:hypothetical protein
LNGWLLWLVGPSPQPRAKRTSGGNGAGKGLEPGSLQLVYSSPPACVSAAECNRAWRSAACVRDFAGISGGVGWPSTAWAFFGPLLVWCTLLVVGYVVNGALLSRKRFWAAGVLVASLVAAFLIAFRMDQPAFHWLPGYWIPGTFLLAGLLGWQNAQRHEDSGEGKR